MKKFFLYSFFIFLCFYDLFAMKQDQGESSKKSRKRDGERSLEEDYKKFKIYFKNRAERDEDELIDLFEKKIDCTETEESVILNLIQSFRDKHFEVVCKKMINYSQEEKYSTEKKFQFFEKALVNFKLNLEFEYEHHIRDFLMYCIKAKVFDLIEPCLKVGNFLIHDDHLLFLDGACQYNNVEALTIFIKHGMDINLQDELYGGTPLHTAVNYKSTDCVEVLLQHPTINLSVEDAQGLTAKNYIDEEDEYLLSLFETTSKKHKQENIDESDN